MVYFIPFIKNLSKLENICLQASKSHKIIIIKLKGYTNQYMKEIIQKLIPYYRRITLYPNKDVINMDTKNFVVDITNQERLYLIKKFNQSQSHGFIWENEIRHKVFNLPVITNDTKKYDINCNENIFNNKENISIKTSSSNKIDCGDIIRFYDNIREGEKTTIILLRYIQDENTKILKEIIEIDYNTDFRNYLFGNATVEVLQDYVNFIKNIPPGKVCIEKKREYILKKEYIQNKYNMKLIISPKIDSKNQRRVQCSIPNIIEILKNSNYVISKNTETVLRNISITKKIESSQRKRR